MTSEGASRSSSFFYFTSHRQSVSDSIESFPTIESSSFEMGETLHALMQTTRQKRPHKILRDSKHNVRSINNRDSPRIRKRRMVRSMAMPSLLLPTILPVDPAEVDVSFEALLKRATSISNDCDMEEDQTEDESESSSSIGLPLYVTVQPMPHEPSSSFPVQNSVG